MKLKFFQQRVFDGEYFKILKYFVLKPKLELPTYTVVYFSAYTFSTKACNKMPSDVICPEVGLLSILVTVFKLLSEKTIQYCNMILRFQKYLLGSHMFFCEIMLLLLHYRRTLFLLLLIGTGQKCGQICLEL